jgi:DNA-binding response OmpR family regulator
MRIAAVEDDIILLELLQATMERAGHSFHGHLTANGLLKNLRSQTFDLLLVDWHLPDMSGPDLVRSARKLSPSGMPILFLTRRNGEQDVIDGLGSGADDFMTKPVRLGEMAARINALLRRAYPDAMAGAVDFGRFRFDPQTHVLYVDGVAVELKHKEYELALCLFQNTGRLMSRNHLRELVWGEVDDIPSRTVDTHASRLRTKLDLTPDKGYALTAIYGIGYRLDPLDALNPD